MCEGERECVCVLEVPMAEFAEDGSLPPLNPGDTAVPSDKAARQTHCEVSVLNGGCGISDGMVGAGMDAANTPAGPDSRAEIPRRSSIIKVNTEVQVSVHVHAGHSRGSLALAWISEHRNGCLFWGQ